MMLLRLAFASAWNRRYTLVLVLLSVALAVTLLLGVERLRHAARQAFSQSVSGTDLVIGARTSPVQLVLYSVFRLGEATNNMKWSSYESLAKSPLVAWSVPRAMVGLAVVVSVMAGRIQGGSVEWPVASRG